MNTKSEETMVVSVRVSKSTFDTLEYIAKKNRRKRTNVAREMIERGISALSEGTATERMIKMLANFSRDGKRSSKKTALLIEQNYTNTVFLRVILAMLENLSIKKLSKSLSQMIDEERIATDQLLAKQIEMVVKDKDKLSGSALSMENADKEKNDGS